MPSVTNFSGCSMGSSTTSRILSICSLQPPMSLRQGGQRGPGRRCWLVRAQAPASQLPPSRHLCQVRCQWLPPRSGPQ